MCECGLLAVVALALLAPAQVAAQHQHPPAAPAPPAPPPVPEGKSEHADHGEHADHADHADHTEHGGEHAVHGQQPGGPVSAVDLDAARNASGTAWQPEHTPHAAFHGTAAGWNLMFHTLLFAGYDYQATDRGDHAPVGVGWVMGMAGRRLGSGAFLARVMLSPEPWTARLDGGYPLLLQTGETYRGQPLHDRQHPHDLFMEVALMYTQPIGDALALQLYLAPAGEPALGPVAFPHRHSAASDPLAALSHHWLDSTHISFGVVTAGIVTRRAKLEASWFNGREPDETRYDFDLRRPDALAVRASLAPSPAWSAQVSYGYLSDHEILHPGESMHRGTASAMYHAPRARAAGAAGGGAGHWSTIAALGINKHAHDSPSAALLLESNLDLDGRNVVFARAEAVQKSGHDLVLSDPAVEPSRFLLFSLAAGYLHNFPTLAGLVAGIGVRAALGWVPEAVRPFYGTRTLAGGIVFLRLAVAAAPAHH